MTLTKNNLDEPWRILVVDDEEGSASDTVRLLERRLLEGTAGSGGFMETVAFVAESSFDKALEMVSRGEFDLLVLGRHRPSWSKFPTPKDTASA